MQEPTKDKGSIANGAITSIVIHAALLFILFVFTLSTTIKYDNIPESDFIAVELEEKKPVKPPVQTQAVDKGKIVGKPEEQAPPRVKTDNKTRPPKANNKPDTKATTAGDEGDIERHEPPQPKVNERAIFQSTTDGSELNNEQSKIKDNSLFTGTSNNNDEPTRTATTQSGPSTSTKGVSYSLSGRSVSGGFPKPKYGIQKSGKVVVEITVDRNGVVTQARATAKGSTLQDATLWREAENAALKARFNVDKNATPLQTGTITYIFTLN